MSDLEQLHEVMNAVSHRPDLLQQVLGIMRGDLRTVPADGVRWRLVHDRRNTVDVNVAEPPAMQSQGDSIAWSRTPFQDPQPEWVRMEHRDGKLYVGGRQMLFYRPENREGSRYDGRALIEPLLGSDAYGALMTDTRLPGAYVRQRGMDVVHPNVLGALKEYFSILAPRALLDLFLADPLVSYVEISAWGNLFQATSLGTPDLYYVPVLEIGRLLTAEIRPRIACKNLDNSWNDRCFVAVLGPDTGISS